jgi:hypothetical protein
MADLKSWRLDFESLIPDKKSQIDPPGYDAAIAKDPVWDLGGPAVLLIIPVGCLKGEFVADRDCKFKQAPGPKHACAQAAGEGLRLRVMRRRAREQDGPLAWRFPAPRVPREL